MSDQLLTLLEKIQKSLQQGRYSESRPAISDAIILRKREIARQDQPRPVERLQL